MKRLLILICFLLLACVQAQSTLPQAQLNGRVLQGVVNGITQWSVNYPVELGDLHEPIQEGDHIYLPLGSMLDQLSVVTGVLENRWYFPAPIGQLERTEVGLLVMVDHGQGIRENFTLQNNKIQERVVYPPRMEVLRELERRARLGLSQDPMARLSLRVTQELEARVRQDPLNPFLWIFLGQQRFLNRDNLAAHQALGEAMRAEVPFFISVRMGVLLDSMGAPEYANQALTQAKMNWAELGYDPAVPVSARAWEAYGNALWYSRYLLAQGRVERAGVWFKFLREISPRFEGYASTYEQYAGWLEDQGRTGEAIGWRNIERELAQNSLFSLGEHALLTIQEVARLTVFTLLASYLVIWLTLHLRYLGLQFRELQPYGGLFSGFRNPLMRVRHVIFTYATFSEKLVVLTLFLLGILALGVWGWSSRAQQATQSAALNMGTYGGVWFYSQLDSVSAANSPEASYLRGVAVQLDGDQGRALELYQQAPDVAAALNNQGVMLEMRGDQKAASNLYREALTVNPNLVAAAYNLQLSPSSFETTFQSIYHSGPRLAFPTDVERLRAVSPDFSEEANRFLRNPWTYLMALPTGFNVYLQALWVAWLLASTLLTVLLFMVPRPRSAREEIRPWLFRVMTVLLPGSGLIDEVWGLLLLVPFVVFCLVLGFYRWGYSFSHLYQDLNLNLMFALLIGVYAVNLIGLMFEEFAFYRRNRRRTLRRSASPK
ncbi:hypothetical protein [Deinococcus roseus]|uniref:Tetratricopeptide repeat protein n=1 Tax=Deinococcus roseus TaxID=392414 RepID=A0ABQ2CW08_9DEIO|nr:hypothetical protein [Deinococcus roseus]GGJ25042.1 hypothetical protein GCM10008938_08930 [Deinococcus roseus]